MEADDPRRVGAIEAAAQRLRVDYATAEVLRAFDVARVPTVLLKGPSVTRWLYEPGEARSYADCDLLVSPDRFGAAVDALVTLGFEPELVEAEMPEWWREHALTALRAGDGAMVDLHRTLPGVQATDERVWATLSAATEPVAVGGVEARTLTAPGRALHLALHVAQHGGGARDLDPLARALAQLDGATWRAAAGLADALQAQAAFARGLRFLPDGAQLADRLGLCAEPEIDVELRAAKETEALSFARLMQAQGTRERLALVRHKLAPPATFMRKWSPLARRGRLGLTVAYVWRPFWILGRSPRAVRAWLQARRTT